MLILAAGYVSWPPYRGHFHVLYDAISVRPRELDWEYRVDVVVDGKCINAKRNDVLHDVKMLNVSAQLEGHDMM